MTNPCNRYCRISAREIEALKASAFYFGLAVFVGAIGSVGMALVFYGLAALGVCWVDCGHFAETSEADAHA